MGIDTVELVLQIEEEFKIDIPDEDAQKIVTVGDMARYIEKTTAASQMPCTFEYSLNRVIRILVDDFGVKRQLISSSSRFVNELGLQ